MIMLPIEIKVRGKFCDPDCIGMMHVIGYPAECLFFPEPPICDTGERGGYRRHPLCIERAQ